IAQLVNLWNGEGKLSDEVLKFISLSQRQNQEHLDLKEAPWPRRSFPVQTNSFLVKPSFRAQVTPAERVTFRKSISNKEPNTVSATNESDFSKYSSSNVNSDFNFGVSKSQEPEPMENNDRTLKELATLDVVYQPWCIQYLQLEPAQSYELKSSLIHLLPKFHGLASEDPHKHLKEFHMACSTMRP
ncbi:hypothetical protein CR513_11626, partial [Mucuna pruriens]